MDEQVRLVIGHVSWLLCPRIKGEGLKREFIALFVWYINFICRVGSASGAYCCWNLLVGIIFNFWCYVQDNLEKRRKTKVSLRDWFFIFNKSTLKTPQLPCCLALDVHLFAFSKLSFTHFRPPSPCCFDE